MHSHFLPQIAAALSNQWPLRTLDSEGRFCFKGELSDKETLLDSAGSLKNFERCTRVGMIGFHLYEDQNINFLCLDFDSKDADLNTKIKEYIKLEFNPNDLFIRIGNPEKLGQFWFQTEAPINSKSIRDNLDIITTQKRCDAFGFYKGDNSIIYGWPKKSPDKFTPSDLPFITEDQINEIKEIIMGFIGEDIPTTHKGLNLAEMGRHDFLIREASLKAKQGYTPQEVYHYLIQTEQYESLLDDESRSKDVEKEIHRIMLDAFKYAIDDRIYKEDITLEQSHAIADFSNSTPAVESGSFLDILTRATRRNQYKHSKTLAFFSSLSATAWLLTFSTRKGDMSPNLLFNIVAKSGSGKSDNSKVIHKLVGLEPRLDSTVFESITTTAAFTMSFSDAPNQMRIANEFSEVLKKAKGSTYTGDINETLMKYYSDFPDDRIASVKNKGEVYGVCLGAKLNGLFFTTPDNYRKLIDVDSFTGGLGRRTFVVLDTNTYLLRKNREDKDYYFNSRETAKIKAFLDEWVFIKNGIDNLEEGWDWFDLFEEVDISDRALKTGRTLKRKDGTEEILYHKTARTCRIKNRMEYSEEADEYIKNQHIDNANKHIANASKTANEMKVSVVSSYTEFVEKLSMIHSLAGKKIPTTVIGLDSIKWAEEMVNYYIIQNFMTDVEGLFTEEDKRSQKIASLAEKFYKKLKEKKEKSFKLSSPIPLIFFQNARKPYREEVFQYLQAHGKIELCNVDASKNSREYGVL